MKEIIEEYGGVMVSVGLGVVVIAIILAVGGIGGRLVTVYKTDKVYGNELFADNELSGLISSTASDPMNPLTAFDAGDGVLNPLYGMHKHYFYLSSSIKDEDYVLEVPSASALKVDPRTGLKNTTSYTYDELLDLFSAGGKIRLNLYDSSSGKYWSEMGGGADGSTLPVTDSSLSSPDVDEGMQIVVTQMTPVSSGGNGGSVSNAIVYENVYLKDKFGNKVFDADGKAVKTKEIKYNSKTYNKEDMVTGVDPYDSSNTNFKFTINWDTASKFKVNYRYTKGTIKAEYTAVFINKVRTASDIYEEVFGDWEKERS